MGEKGMEINEQEVREILARRLAPYIRSWADEVARYGITVNYQEVLSAIINKSINAFYELNRSFDKKIEEAERRVKQAIEDLEKCKKEKELRTADPLKFIVATGEHIARNTLTGVGIVSRKQGMAMDGQTSKILGRVIRKSIQA